MSIESISLSQLTGNVKTALQNNFPFPVWVVGEISEINQNRSGHCYLELIEKEPDTDKIAAKCRATIWTFAFRMIKPYFETTSGETLRAGLKVLVKASVEFHEVYGFSLNITDIDPQFTIGDIARKRALVIKQLQEDGVIEMNQMLSLVIVPQRIAVISSETAAGFGDFTDQLMNNPYGFDFYTHLFPALMQGDQAPQSIINAFEQIYALMEDFDAVVLLRGGGSKNDLSCFDDYGLAYYITQFPLPVITGIGHERDDSVVDMVAHTRLKTPTAVAGFLIESVAAFASQLDENLNYVKELVQQKLVAKDRQLQDYSFLFQASIKEVMAIHQQKLVLASSHLVHGIRQFNQSRYNQLDRFSASIKTLSTSLLLHETERLQWNQKRLVHGFQQSIKEQEQRLKHLAEKAAWADPQSILERGFSIVIHQGKILKDVQHIQTGDVVNVRLARGQFKGAVDEIKEESH